MAITRDDTGTPFTGFGAPVEVDNQESGVVPAWETENNGQWALEDGTGPWELE